MKIYEGKAVSEGVALGPAAVFRRCRCQVERTKIEDTELEFQRVQDAVLRSEEQLYRLYEKAGREVGADGAAIFEAQKLLLKDEELLGLIRDKINREHISAEYASILTGEELAMKFSCMDDPYMRDRAADIRDVTQSLVSSLRKEGHMDFVLRGPSVIFAENLSAGEIMQLDRNRLLGIVTVQGSVNSHAAILARTMHIPALVGVPLELDIIRPGTETGVDAFKGTVILEPDEAFCERLRRQAERETKSIRLLEELKGKQSVTKSGQRLRVLANIGNMEDLSSAWENDAEGVGLFRSEFLYLGRKDFPSEEEQFQVYRRTVQEMKGRRVVVRTMDMGADKQADYLHLGRESNPAMGYRGIRICLKQPEIFRVQLRALLRAAVFGDLWVLYPMIISSEEVREIKRIVEETAEELEKAQVPFKIPRQGVMIETPAAVMISDELAELADFFSIGTNDLTQYTLAVDRQNGKLDAFYNPRHKAVMRMIQMVVANGHKYEITVGICGEMGADLSLTEEFIRMGVDEVSVVPSMILKVRRRIREIE